jgi:starch phosphorylase
MPRLLSRDLPGELAGLKDLALDVRWTWSHEADDLWRRIDGDAWVRTRNPWSILQGLSDARLGQLAADIAFIEEFHRIRAARLAYIETRGWFRATHGDAALGGVAYFSLEFGLSDALPLYAGGLGILAGDLLKTASDLAVPIIGVSLLYQVGYFRQTIDAGGWQHELYPYNNPDELPIDPVMNGDGQRLRIEIELPGRTLLVRVWQAVVGHARLYLLDSNDDHNSPADRGITGRLYDEVPETRLLQEIILGVGGWRVIQALAPSVELCHLNEGHAAFVVVERARQFMANAGTSFAEALWATRAGNVFTTHTSVGAGFDRFPVPVVEKYLTALCCGSASGAREVSDIIAMARADRADDQEPFNMAFLALRGSLLSFGVSRLHGHVSRLIFQPLFPRWPEAEAPIGYITNGVHMPSWDSESADEIWTNACGKERWRGMPDDLSQAIQAQSDEALWEVSSAGRRRLIAAARARLARHLSERGLPAVAISEADQVLDPNILTLGFARRFTGYKRLDLLLRDPARLAQILNHPTRPAQLVIAGKAHPADEQGKKVIQEWITTARRPEFRHRLVFLEDYDMALAQELVQGVDVWINTPRRPWEACGTSGMKVLVNGGLNLSELDGWWEEAYRPEVGWAIGGSSLPPDSDVDPVEAEQLYAIIERSIAPEFYDRDGSGIPREWISRIRRSMAELTPAYSSNRMVLDYVERAYLPAVAQQRHRTKSGGEAAKDMQLWLERLGRNWGQLHIGDTGVSATDRGWSFSTAVYFGDMAPKDVKVKLYADALAEGAPEIHEMSQGQPIIGSGNGYIYAVQIACSRPAEDYTVRIIPFLSGVRAPTEATFILWQR